jgi:hypothetical protein
MNLDEFLVAVINKKQRFLSTKELCFFESQFVFWISGIRDESIHDITRRIFMAPSKFALAEFLEKVDNIEGVLIGDSETLYWESQFYAWHAGVRDNRIHDTTQYIFTGYLGDNVGE